jgi:acyl-CoA thioester hydrolase
VADPFDFPVAVRMADVDPAGVVFNAHDLGWCDDARFAFLDHLGHPFDPGRSTAVGMVRHAEVDWFAPLRLFDAARIQVLTERVGETSYTLRFDIGRPDIPERTCARAVITYVLVDLLSGRPTALPKDLRAALLADQGCA